MITNTDKPLSHTSSKRKTNDLPSKNQSNVNPPVIKNTNYLREKELKNEPRTCQLPLSSQPSGPLRNENMVTAARAALVRDKLLLEEPLLLHNTATALPGAHGEGELLPRCPSLS